MFTTLNAPEVQEAVHRYPGITFIAQALSQNTSRRVLDLGSASAASFNFFMRKGCTVRFENVSQFVADQLKSSPENRDPAAIRQHLEGYLNSFRSHEKFDVVLTWDLFNFLDLKAINWLTTKLSAFCHDQSLLHSVRYLNQAPIAPLQYQIVSEYEIKSHHGNRHLTHYTPHALPELVRNLPYYHLDTCFSQQNGMPANVCEDVLRFMPAKKNIKRHDAKMEQPQVSAESLPGTPHQSYALESLCEHLAHIEEPRILDLGANIASNLEFYQNFSSHIAFAELFQSLKRDISPEELLSTENLLQCNADEKFDVIFAWGLLG